MQLCARECIFGFNPLTCTLTLTVKTTASDDLLVVCVPGIEWRHFECIIKLRQPASQHSVSLSLIALGCARRRLIRQRVQCWMNIGSLARAGESQLVLECRHRRKKFSLIGIPCLSSVATSAPKRPLWTGYSNAHSTRLASHQDPSANGESSPKQLHPCAGWLAKLAR